MYSYYPCLISKEGEINALKRLDQTNKESTCPLLDIVQEGIGLEKVAEELKKHWCFEGNQVMIDYSRFTTVQGLNKIDGLFKTLRHGDVNAIPVLSLSANDMQKSLAKSRIAKNNLGIAIRIPFKQGNISKLPATLTSLMKELAVKEADTILLLDFGFVQIGDVNRVIDTFVDNINSIPENKNFKAIILLAGSFPKDLSSFVISSKPQPIRRIEETIYVKVSKVLKFVKYGDYGTKHPDYVPSNKHAGTCSMKYSTKNSFVIYRGKLAKNSPPGNAQYVKHCKNLVKSTTYFGEGFSWGDGKIKKISKEKISDDRAKTGNATTWVTISWSHHMTLINHLASN
jgi:hypothetical protein